MKEQNHRNMCTRFGDDIYHLVQSKDNTKKYFDIEDESRCGRLTMFDETEINR